MRFLVNRGIEWVSHVLNESQHGEDFKNGSFSLEGGEEAASPKASSGFKVKVF